MTIKDYFGNDVEVKVKKATYQNNGNLAVQLLYHDKEYDFWEPYATLTVNLGKLPDGYAYIDINNVPNGDLFVEENHLGEPTGDYGFSGFCCYPLYKFY